MVASHTNRFMGVSADSGVLTETGLRKASSVRIGDKVLTKSGEYEKVKEILSTGETKQTVYKLTLPLVDDVFDSTCYISPDAVVYGLPKRTDMATEIVVSELTSDSYVFLPSEVQQQAPILSYQLRGQKVISQENGVFIPIGRIVKTERKINLISFATESGSFVASGITVQD